MIITSDCGSLATDHMTTEARFLSLATSSVITVLWLASRSLLVNP